jgi:hypothetical protein
MPFERLMTLIEQRYVYALVVRQTKNLGAEFTIPALCGGDGEFGDTKFLR